MTRKTNAQRPRYTNSVGAVSARVGPHVGIQEHRPIDIGPPQAAIRGEADLLSLPYMPRQGAPDEG
jgi:hypothetical protein